MAKRKVFETVLLITADEKGGVKAVRATKEEMEALNKTQDQGAKSAKKYGDQSKKSSENVKTLGDRAKTAGGFIVKAIGAAVTVTAGLFAVNSKLIQQSDRVAKQLGISTQQFAIQSEKAREAGLDMEAYGDTIRDVAVRVQELAIVGTGEAVDFMDRMNLDVQEFKDLKPDELIKALGKEMEVLNRNEKILFLDQLGSDNAVALVDIIGQLDELEHEAIALGTALSDVDSAMVSQAAVDLDRVGMVARGAANQITVGLSPIVSDLSSRFFDAAVEAGGVGSAVEIMVNGAASGVGFILDELRQMQILLKTAEVGWVHVGTMGTAAMASNTEAAAALINGALEPILGTLGAIADGWGVILLGMSMVGGPFSEQLENASDSLSAFSRNAKAFKVDTQDILDLNSAMQAQLLESRSELNQLLKLPPPSDGIDQWLEEVRAKAEEVAEAEVAAREELESLTEENGTATQVVKELIEQMEFENSLLGQTSLEQKVQTNLRRLDSSATDEQRAAVRRLTIERHREEEGLKKLAEELKTTEQIRNNQIENVQKFLGEAIRDQLSESGKDWDDYFDDILKGLENVYAQFLSKNLTEAMFNGGSTNIGDILGLTGSASGTSGSLWGSISSGASGLSGLAGLFGGGSGSALPAAGAGGDAWSAFYGDTAASGTFNDGASLWQEGGANLKNVGVNLVAGYVGSAAGNAAGEALFDDKVAESGTGATIGGAIGSIWGPIGTMVGSFLGGLVDVGTGGDGWERTSLGFSTGGQAAVKDKHTFGQREFKSGLDITLINRRGEEAATEAIVSIFEAVHDRVFDLADQAGGQLRLDNVDLLGTSADFGTNSGNFFGLRGGQDGLEGRAALEPLLNSFTDQLLDHVTGLDADVAEALQNASGNAADLIAAFEQALDPEGLADGINELGEAANDSVNQIATFGDLFSNTQNYVNSIVSSYTATIQRQYDEQFRLEEQLHDRRVEEYQSQIDLAGTLSDSLNSFLQGNLSSLSNRDKQSLAESQFNALADKALGGDAEAGGKLFASFESLAGITRTNYASSLKGDGIVDNALARVEEVMGVMGSAVSPGPFDPRAANDRVVELLGSMDERLSTLPEEMGLQMAAVMGNFITQSKLFGNSDTYTANRIAGLGDQAVAGAESIFPGFVSTNASTSEEVISAVEDIWAGTGTELERLTTIMNASISAGIGSDQLTGLLGKTKEEMDVALSILGVPSFDIGTGYVRQDMLARVHQGEGIIRADDMGFLRKYGISVAANDNSALLRELTKLNSTMQSVREQNADMKNVFVAIGGAAHDQRERANDLNETVADNTIAINRAGLGASNFA